MTCRTSILDAALRVGRQRANKPLVPTRNGEAPLLTAQRRRSAANMNWRKNVAIAVPVMCLISHGVCGLAAESASEPLPEIQLTDPNWNFPAYFTIAAERDAAEMKRYLNGVCLKFKMDDDVWFCSSAASFIYSGVDGWGKLSRSGYVCQFQLGLPGQRYFGDSRFKEYGCLYLWWNEDEGQYEMELPGDDRS